MLLSQSLQELKITDFGLHRYFDMKALATGRGYKKYAAPEVLKSGDKDSQVLDDYPFACDVYSWALCCYYALTGNESRRPQADKLPAVIGQRVLPNTNRTLAAFLNAAISDNAADRPTAAECEDTLKNYQENCKGSLLSLSIKSALFRFASTNLPQTTTNAIGSSTLVLF